MSTVPNFPQDTKLTVAFDGSTNPELVWKDTSDAVAKIGSIETGSSVGRFSVQLTFENWTKDNYVFMPTAVYAGNRFPATPQPYSPCPEPMPVDTPPYLLGYS